MDYRACAHAIYNAIGQKENIVTAAHCATRLRLVIADNDKVDMKELEEIEGVKGVFQASGQLQVIIGTGAVNKVFDELIQIAGISAGSKEDVKQAASAKTNLFQRAIKTLGDVFVPIIPAIVASGLLMGLLEGLSNVFPQMAQSGTYTIIHLFSNAAFVFLPILIATSAAKVFSGNIFLGAVIGMIMIHPDLMNAWNVAGAEHIPSANVWFGLYNINLVGYQGHVIPIVIAVWFMSILEKKLHKIVPEIIDLFVTPLVTVLATGYLSLTIFGPVFSTLENAILDGVQYLISIPFGIGAFFVGGLYAPTVVAGIHHMYNALEAGMLSANGINTWMPIATAANVAQGAAALALAIKTKNKKTKSLALPASLSAFLGITEPAIFGVNMRFIKCFIAGCVGGACGGLIAGLTGIGASAYGITGLFGYLITTAYSFQYTLIMLTAFSVAFALSWFFYRDEPAAAKAEPAGHSAAGSAAAFCGQTGSSHATKNSGGLPETICSPADGQVIPLEEVPDQTFASGALGKGVALLPSKGEIVAPADCRVSVAYETGHAIGLTTESGIELLIHVGINTVELGGAHFRMLVKEGQRVRKGSPLIHFDRPKISSLGYHLATPVIVTNSDEFGKVETEHAGQIRAGEKLLSVSRG